MRWKWILGIATAAVIIFLIIAYFIAASYDYNKLKPVITDTAKKYTGRELTLGGDIGLKIGLPPILEVNAVAFQNASWGSQPQMAQIKHMQVQVDILPLLRGNVSVNRLILVEPKFMLEVNKSGQTNLDFAPPLKDPAQKQEDKVADKGQTHFEFKEVRLKDGEIVYKNHQTGKTETMELSSLELKAPFFGAATDIDLKGSYNKTPFQLKGNIGQLSGIQNPKEKWPLKLEAQAVKTKVSIEGSIQDPMTAQGIELKLNVEGEDLAQFEKISGKPLPMKGPFRLAGQFKSPSQKTVQVSDLLLKLGDSQIQGSVKVTRADKRPLIEAKFTSKKLDLRPVLAEKKSSQGSSKQKAASGGRKNKVFSNQPFDLSDLQKYDARISLRVEQIIGLITVIDNYQAEINLQNGHLKINPITGDMGGGKFSATMDLATQANNAKLNSKITAQNINLGEMLKKMDISDDIEGTLELDIDLAGNGNSVAAVMAGLNGHFIVSMGRGKMPTRYLDLVGADLSSSLVKILNPFEEKIDRAEINCAVCDFDIKNGIANGDAIIIDDPQKTLISDGTLNLKTEALNFGIQTRPKGGVGTKETGKISISLSEITKPFELSGTLANPYIGISPGRTATILGRALLAPGGIATLFVSHSSGNQNPCVEALKIHKEQVAGRQKTSDKETAQEGSKPKKKEGLGSKIMNLFKKSED